jgi:FKBP-type peptidyl-prolyl cis-trans isomerase SlpA
MSVITQNSKISLHFSLATEQGIEIDSTFDKSPARFTMGDGSLLPGFENCLLGLQAGDEQQFILAAVDAFGEVNPDSIYELDIKQFQGMEVLEGLVVSFEGAGKQPMPGVVKKIKDDKVTVDFNHPLAGQRMVFKVRIVSVE